MVDASASAKDDGASGGTAIRSARETAAANDAVACSTMVFRMGELYHFLCSRKV